MNNSEPNATDEFTGFTANPRPSNIRVRLSGAQSFRDSSEGETTKAIKDFLRASLQMQHLVILSGSGTSTEAGGPSMGDLWKAAEGIDGFVTTRSAISYGDGNDIEEFLSRCDAFSELNPDEIVVQGTRKAIIAMILTKCRLPSVGTSNLAPHQDLLKKVARRRVRDSRVKLFTTNYDLCFERAAADLGLLPIDGFSFSHPRRFDPQFFDFDIVKRGTGFDKASYVSGVFQYYKLHGSIDWSSAKNQIEINADVSSEDACLIYPARAKFQRSYQQPHLELMARYLAALREPNTCLVVVGFGFNDAHLAAPILSAVRANPHFRLIVISRTIDKRLENAVAGTAFFELEELARRADVSFFASSFANFVATIPDLAALSPAHDLESAVLRITKGE